MSRCVIADRIGRMGRWEPNASGRLRAAAMELYLERGYEQTTVADIAQRAGLTARTFFRYFADKREVLFAGATDLQGHLVSALERAPASAPPMAAVAAALYAAGDVLVDREYSRKRQTVITANAELQERELIKLASLSAAFAGALRGRGVPDAEASLAAETGVAVFRVGFERWINGPDERPLAEVMKESLEQLSGLTAVRLSS
jgi:AcrR family transcriptional regulator